MIKLIFPLLGLIFLNSNFIQAQTRNTVESGSGDFLNVDIDTGSGTKSVSLSVNKNNGLSVILTGGLSDDEDDPIEGSGPQETKHVTERISIPVEGSGSLSACAPDGIWCWCIDDDGNQIPGTRRFNRHQESEDDVCISSPVRTRPQPSTTKTPTTTAYRPEGMKCSPSGLYCWCEDTNGREVPETRIYVYNSPLSRDVTCPTVEASTTTIASTKAIEVTTPMQVFRPDRMVCEGQYCWCLDIYGQEMPETRMYMSNTPLSPYVSCPTGETTKAVVPTTPTTPTTVRLLPEGVACSDDAMYCWCVNKYGQERPNTRRRMSTYTTISCDETPATTPKDSDSDIIIVNTVEETTTTRTRKTTPYKPAVNIDDINEKTDKPAVPNEDDEYLEGAGKGGLGGGIDLEDLRPEGALFTHPGILAVIIGGGVVALLSAMLLIMFIIYRMRKKDEGSYPLDPDTKPPRLHTYTRAPNKEFYA